MKKIKPTTAAGKFYTNNKDELSAQIDFFIANNTHDYKYNTRAIIVPHAGYMYSGQLACNGFQLIVTIPKILNARPRKLQR